MKILGINHSHDAGAVIIEDGRIVAAVNEERLNRIKLYWGFPLLSINEVLRVSGLKPSDIDFVAVSNLTPGAGIGQEYHEYNLRRRIMSYMAYLPFIFGSSIFSSAYKAFYSLFRSKSNLREVLRKKYGIDVPVNFVEHHVAHAASAFYTSPFEQDTLVITTDGAGDGICASVSIVNQDFEMKRVSSTPFFHSPASIYGYTTYNLGYTPNKDEGKLTGLAAHGRAEKAYDIYRNIVSVKGMQYNVSLYPPWGYRAVKKLHMLTWHKRRDDIAAALQKRSEDVAVSFVQNCQKKYPRNNIALAGGFFANVRINQAIAEIPQVKKIFIHPHMGDGGLAAGAAYWVWSQKLLNKGLKPNPVFHDTMYFGPEFAEEEIESALKEGGLKYRHVKNIEQEAAELVKKGKVIGRFNGRMEYGPRALGNRSIVASPIDKSINEWLNKKLHRCYDDQTEILTSDGWKYMKDLSKKELVATLNPKTNVLEYQNILDYVSYEFNGKMFSIRNKRIDLVVTPNHNMWVKKKGELNFKIEKIESVAKIKDYHYQKVGEGKKDVVKVMSSGIQMIDYQGKVYCVTVPNHIIFVRRNGKSVFCGNTEFMPFAPSMMRDHAEEYFNNFEKGEYAANFMTMTFDCTKKCAKDAPAITHIDNTARPQTVTKEQNPSYYKLLTIYKELTGLPIFVNTSFNEHEHPIVCTPKDAVESFKQGNIDALAIGNYLVVQK